MNNQINNLPKALLLAVPESEGIVRVSGGRSGIDLGVLAAFDGSAGALHKTGDNLDYLLLSGVPRDAEGALLDERTATDWPSDLDLYFDMKAKLSEELIVSNDKVTADSNNRTAIEELLLYLLKESVSPNFDIDFPAVADLLNYIRECKDASCNEKLASGLRLSEEKIESFKFGTPASLVSLAVRRASVVSSVGESDEPLLLAQVRNGKSVIVFIDKIELPGGGMELALLHKFCPVPLGI